LSVFHRSEASNPWTIRDQLRLRATFSNLSSAILSEIQENVHIYRKVTVGIGGATAILSATYLFLKVAGEMCF
jgi:hypothetical protein